MNTPQTDIGKKVQRFDPGQNSTIFPCDLATGFPSSSVSSFQNNPNISQFQGPNAPVPNCFNTGTTPTGLVVPGDKGVPGGLFSTYYNAFAPRLGLNWSPSWKDGLLGKLTGGPNKATVSMGWGLFYNPIEQLVLEQFSAEPPFGISNGVSNPLFSTPFVTQEGTTKPNVSDAFLNPPRNHPVDWALYRPIVLFGQFPTKLRTQYSAQYNLTIKRELPGNILLQVGYVGSQGHRLLAIHDQNAANPQPCLDMAAISNFYGPFQADGVTPNPNSNPGLFTAHSCGPFFEDSAFSLPANSKPAGQWMPRRWDANFREYFQRRYSRSLELQFFTSALRKALLPWVAVPGVV